MLESIDWHTKDTFPILKAKVESKDDDEHADGGEGEGGDEDEMMEGNDSDRDYCP